MPPASLPPHFFHRPPSSAPPRPVRNATPRGVAPWFSPPPQAAAAPSPCTGPRAPFRRPLPPQSAPVRARRPAPHGPAADWLQISATAADATPIDLDLADIADETVSSVADGREEDEDQFALPPAEIEGVEEEEGAAAWGKAWPVGTAAPMGGVASDCTWMLGGGGGGRKSGAAGYDLMDDMGSGGLCSYRQFGIAPWAAMSRQEGGGNAVTSMGVSGGGDGGGWDIQPMTMPATTWRAPERRDDREDGEGIAGGGGGGGGNAADDVDQDDVEMSARTLLTRRFSAKKLSNGMREKSWYGFDVSDESDDETVVADAMSEAQALEEFNSAAHNSVAEYGRYPEGSSVFGRKSSGMGSGMGSGTSGSQSATATGSSLSSERRSSVAEEKAKAKTSKKNGNGAKGAFRTVFGACMK